MKHILFPTDFSTPANNAFAYAINLAEDLDAYITLFHVFSLPLVSTLLSTAEQTEFYIEEQIISAEKKMDQLLIDNPTHRIRRKVIRCTSFIESEIADYASDQKTDLIIMGMKGEHERLDKWMGSVTTNLMMKAPCPVLAIPEKARYKPIEKVAYARELPSSAEMPMKQLSELASALSAKVEFVTVENLVRRTKSFKPGQERTTYFGVDYDVVTNPSIPDGLNNYVISNNTDVLSLYMPKRKLWERLFHFSTSEEMAYHTVIPLLVFHQ